MQILQDIKAQAMPAIIYVSSKEEAGGPLIAACAHGGFDVRKVLPPPPPPTHTHVRATHPRLPMTTHTWQHP